MAALPGPPGGQCDLQRLEVLLYAYISAVNAQLIIPTSPCRCRIPERVSNVLLVGVEIAVVNADRSLRATRVNDPNGLFFFS